MSKNWVWIKQVGLHKKVYPKKGAGQIWSERYGYWPWAVFLDNGEGEYVLLDDGFADSYEEAQRIVDDTFALIEPMEKE